jgi:large subunit ribosomal protein L32
MPNPRNRHSKQRKRQRRTHYVSVAPNTGNCNNCGAPKLSHRVCGECGFYKGKQVIVVKRRELAPAIEEDDTIIEE